MLTIRSLTQEIKSKLGYAIKRDELRSILINDLNMKFGAVKSQGAYINYEKNIILRQLFAVKMIKFIQQKRIIVYWDETHW